MIEVDIWVRGTLHAETYQIGTLPSDVHTWGDDEVRLLLTEMLRALDREKNPGAERAPITLRGFSWIVSPDPTGGVLVHLEMPSGTASAGPLDLDEPTLTAMMSRVMAPPPTSPTVH